MKLVLVYTGGVSCCGFIVPEEKIGSVLVRCLLVLVLLHFGEGMRNMYAFSTDF